jgi:maltooligosyltrehalose synthase
MLFEGGHYLPLETRGPHADKLLAFVRNHRDKGQETSILLAVTILRGREWIDLGACAIDWWGTDVLLPPGWEGDWEDVLNHQVKRSERDGDHVMPARVLMADMPVAILKRSIAIAVDGVGDKPAETREERITE